MQRFNPPPGWPTPPMRTWRPGPEWQPSETWPTAPADWPFWVNDAGRPVDGPAGLYGARSSPGRRGIGWGVAAVLVVLLLGSCVAALGSPDGEDAATPATATATVTVHPTQTVTPTRTVAPTTEAPTPTRTGPAVTATVTPTVTVDAPRPAPQPEPEPPRPTGTQPPAPEPPAQPPAPSPEPAPGPGGSAPFENCDAARAAGAAPVLRGDPGYGSHLDGDDDGVGCES